MGSKGHETEEFYARVQTQGGLGKHAAGYHARRGVQEIWGHQLAVTSLENSVLALAESRCSEQRDPKQQTRTALVTKGFVRAMRRAGTPPDHGYAERFVGIVQLAVAERRSSRPLGDVLRAAERWINGDNQHRPHERLHQQSPDH